MSLVTIFGKSFAALVFTWLVGAYKLCDARESFGERGDLIAQVNQQILWCDRIVSTTDCYRGMPVVVSACGQLVWYETAVAKRPQQFVDAVGISAIDRVNVHGVFEPICFLGEPACKGLARLRAGLF